MSRVAPETPTPASGAPLSIVIPAYNEGARIEKTLTQVLEHFGLRPGVLREVLVCDDGSRDATPVLVRGLGQPVVHLLRLEVNRGKGAAVRRGVLAASGTQILVTDADLSTPITAYHALATRLCAATPVVVGSRYLSRRAISQPWVRTAAGLTFAALTRLVLGVRQRDTQCGFKLFTAEAGQFLFRRSEVDGFAYDAEILFVAALHGIPTAEVPVPWTHNNASTIRLAAASRAMIRDLLRIRARRRAYVRDPSSSPLA